MSLTECTYVGPPIDDPGTLARLPRDLRALLLDRNGWVAFRGGLHLRGACREPRWHSIGYWWRGDDALHRLYAELRDTDIPFAEDALGEQYLLRDGEVHRLVATTGDVEQLGMGLRGFLHAAEHDPWGFLALDPLADFLGRGGILGPGELLDVSTGPPRVTAAPALIATLAARAGVVRRDRFARGEPLGGDT